MCCVPQGQDSAGPSIDPPIRMQSKDNEKNLDENNMLDRRARIRKDYEDCVMCKFLLLIFTFFLLFFIIFLSISFAHVLSDLSNTGCSQCYSVVR